jgi:DNA repair protein RecO (recombination protein O)
MAISWEDQGIVLAVRRFGEHDAIVSVLTENQGRHAGIVKGGGGKRGRGLLQQGNLIKAWWRARLDEHLGTFTIEGLRPFAAEAMSSAAVLTGLSSLCAMAEATLPEREPHAAIYRQTLHLLEHLGAPGWEAEYVQWELALLRDMGYGLDLTACAATGTKDDLAYVSPRTGRAVSRTAAEPYVPRLLALPAFLQTDHAGHDAVEAGQIAQGLALTGHFFEAHVFRPHRQQIPASRTRFVDRFRA